MEKEVEEKKEEKREGASGMIIIEMEEDGTVEGGVRELSIAEIKERKAKKTEAVEVGALFDE